MSVDALLAQDHESLEHTQEALRGMMDRLLAISALSAITQDQFVEIAAIYNNVSYVFLYLESNEVHVRYDRLLPWRDAFYKDPALDDRVLRLLFDLRCAEPDAEQARLAYVEYLRTKVQSSSPESVDAAERLQAAAKDVLGKVQRDQSHLLERLGVAAGSARGEAAFYRLLSETKSDGTRAKLARAWSQTRDRHLPDLLGIVDEMIDRRRAEAWAAGHSSVLAMTLERCRVLEADAADYLESYLRSALTSHAELESEIQQALGVDGDLNANFGFYMRSQSAGQTIPLFRLNDCLEFAFHVATEVFGLEVVRLPSRSPHVSTVEVRRDGRTCGLINLDLWDTGPRPRTANYTKAIRNRTDWAGLVQRPVAYVSCRFQRAADGSNRINFQNVHSLFHEFGHALNHLLIRKRLPNQSGLEYLPLERLEDLSMWYEKWVYHGEFAEWLRLTPGERSGLELCQQIKLLEYRRTHVDRAMTAALDFDVHRRDDRGLRDSFADLDERFDVSRFCGLGDFPAYFTWPMLQANPGANFVYLWGAADSAEKFAPFLRSSIDDAPPAADVHALFSDCFDYDEPSVRPDVQAIFDFYDTRRSSDGATRA